MARPARPIDYTQVEKLAGIMCTDAEIASIIGFTHEHFGVRKKTDEPLARALDAGRQNARASLRRLQFMAADAGNPTMLIWLGKQYLGQMDDKQRMEEALRKMLSELSGEQLQAIAGGRVRIGDATE